MEDEGISDYMSSDSEPEDYNLAATGSEDEYGERRKIIGLQCLEVENIILDDIKYIVEQSQYLEIPYHCPTCDKWDKFQYRLEFETVKHNWCFQNYLPSQQARWRCRNCCPNTCCNPHMYVLWIHAWFCEELKTPPNKAIPLRIRYRAEINESGW